MIEQGGPAKAYRREVVIELEDSVLDEGCVRAARGEGEAGCPADANLAEEVVADPRARAGIVGPQDDRGSTVPHLHEIHELALVLGRALRVEVDRARLGADDRDRSCPGDGKETLRDHQRVGETGTRLTELEVGPGEADPVGDERDVRRHQARGRRRVTDQIGEVTNPELRFFQRHTERSGCEIGIGLPRARPLVAGFEIAAHVPRPDSESIRQNGPAERDRDAEPSLDALEQLGSREREARQRRAHAEDPQLARIPPGSRGRMDVGVH